MTPVALPKRPLDRLWVDASRADEARTVVTAEVADLTALLAEEEPGATAHGFVHPVPGTAATRVLKPPSLPEPPPTVATSPSSSPSASPSPGPSTGDTEEVWQQIVDAWGKESDAPVPPWPVSEDVDGDDTRTIADEAATSRRLRRRSDPEPYD